MLRVALAGCLLASLSPSLAAADVCVACDKPAATYVCSLEQVTRDQKFRLGNSVQRHVCAKVLERTHEKCRIVDDTQPCNGVAKLVTFTEYQQAIAGGEGSDSTYEPGALEKAKRSMQAAWGCVTSLFNDC
jgi:hypothetical protein